MSKAPEMSMVGLGALEGSACLEFGRCSGEAWDRRTEAAGV
jgi:hypothetical protein